MKKITMIMGFSVVILGIILLVVGLPYLQHSSVRNYETPSFPQSIGSEGRYTLASSYPVVNGSYPVYATVPPDTTDAEVKRLGSIFGLSEVTKKTEITSDVIQYSDHSEKPAIDLTFYPNSGAYNVRIPEKYIPSTPNTQPDIPSDEEARAIATEYLADHNLLPEDVHFEGVSIGSQYEDYSPTLQVYTLTKHVLFRKEIQGIDVYNAGITVTIGENGEVVGFSNSLRELDPNPVRHVKIISPEEAYKQLLSNNLMVRPMADDSSQIVVKGISLGYWMEIQTMPQEYVFPVYAFSCMSILGDKGEQVMRYVSAVDPSEMEYFS